MKIGILTYHAAHNYGALLQCFALKKYLISLGHDVHVIDYKPSYLDYSIFKLDRWVSKSFFKTIDKLSFQLLTFKKQVSRSRNFNHFINQFIEPVYLDLNNQNHDFDYFIFGSDQIWRKNQGKFDSVFFGQFPAAKSTKLVSYAASMSLASLNDTDKELVRQYLKDFHSINVRESSLQDLLKEVTDSKVNLTVDPTLLLNQEEWNAITASKLIDEKYILLYEVIENPLTNKIAQEYADRFGWKIMRIASKIKKDTQEIVLETASVEEFLALIKYAELVITTSFHGTIFSIIFEKALICIRQNSDADLRVASLLSEMRLSERFVDGSDFQFNLDFISPVKFQGEEFVNSSKSLLIESL